jgi:co-chaperonin GroES (HSP10)
MIPIDAQPGDLVLHHRHALQHCKTPDGDSFSLIAEGDILAKLIEVEEESNG